jgi:hypothetical protein
MIVQTTLTRNECFLIKEMLPQWSKYADGFVFYDDCSDDETVEFLEENKDKYNILSIIRGKRREIEKEITLETDIRGALFQEAKKYTNYITCLDTDEYFDGDGTREDLKNILDQYPDQLIWFKWVQYTGRNEIRVDGPWRNNFKDRAGLYIDPDTKFEKTLRHSLHLPVPPRGSIQAPLGKIFVSHIQWLDKRWVGVKQYFWKVTDYIDRHLHSENTYDASAYDASVNNFQWEYEATNHTLKLREDVYSNQDMKSNFKLKEIVELTNRYNIPNLGDWGMGIYDYCKKCI